VHGTIDGAGVFAAGGRFVTVWRDRAIRYAVGSGPVTTLADADIDSAPTAAAGPSGEVVATWRSPFDDGSHAVMSTLPAGADVFSTPAEVEPGSREASPAVSSGPGGVAIGYVPYGQPWKVQVTRPGSAPQTVATERNNASGTVSVAGPYVALPDTGAIAVWSLTRTKFEGDVPVAGRISAAVQQPGGSFARPVRITPAREFPTSGISVASTRTAAVVLWHSKRGLRYATYAGDRWSRARTLANGAGDEIVVAAAGDHLIAGWQTGTTVKIATLR